MCNGHPGTHTITAARLLQPAGEPVALELKYTRIIGVVVAIEEGAQASIGSKWFGERRMVG